MTEVECSKDEDLLLEDDDDNLIFGEANGDEQDVTFDDREVEDLLADDPEPEKKKTEETPKKSTAPTVYVDSRSRGVAYARGYGYWGRGPPPGYFRGMRPPIPMPPYGMGPRRPFGPRGPPIPFPRGIMRPMMPPPHFYRGRGPRPRYGPPRFEGPAEEEMEEEEEPSEGSGSGPKPLMSIRTPVTIKRAVDYAKGAELASGKIPSGMGLGPRFHPSLRRGGSGRGSVEERPSLKRPADPMGSGDGPGYRGRGSHHEGPPAKVMMTQPQPQLQPQPQNTQVHSNLRQIQTVDDQQYQQQRSRPRAVAAPPAPRPRFNVTHKPAPVLTQIPIVGQEERPQRMRNYSSTMRPRSAKVLITKLPTTATFERISAMTTACGNVRTVNVRSENNTAVIEFINPESVDLFIRQHNKKLFDGTMIEVYRMV